MRVNDKSSQGPGKQLGQTSCDESFTPHAMPYRRPASFFPQTDFIHEWQYQWGDAGMFRGGGSVDDEDEMLVRDGKELYNSKNISLESHN